MAEVAETDRKDQKQAETVGTGSERSGKGGNKQRRAELAIKGPKWPQKGWREQKGEHKIGK